MNKTTIAKVLYYVMLLGLVLIVLYGTVYNYDLKFKIEKDIRLCKAIEDQQWHEVTQMCGILKRQGWMGQVKYSDMAFYNISELFNISEE